MIADPRFARFTERVHLAVAEPGQVPGARTGPQAVSQAHPRHARATEAGAGRVPAVPDPQQPAGAESDRSRISWSPTKRSPATTTSATRPRAASSSSRSRTAGRDLGGVLTQAAILAGLSDGRESNPVKRGAWLARKIIAEPPADPPPNVPALKEDDEGSHAAPAAGAAPQPDRRAGSATPKIDPWGVPFEEFDAGGRLKQQPVDAKSTLPDKTEVAGVNDLKRYLAKIASIRWPSAFSSTWRPMPPAAP